MTQNLANLNCKHETCQKLEFSILNCNGNCEDISLTAFQFKYFILYLASCELTNNQFPVEFILQKLFYYLTERENQSVD